MMRIVTVIAFKEHQVGNWGTGKIGQQKLEEVARREKINRIQIRKTVISGWYNLAATCIFPLIQFERNYSTSVQMCGSVSHSIGFRETNWLIAQQLLEIFKEQNNKDLMKLYWTELKIKNERMIGVESDVKNENNISMTDFTSIYNPLWAEGQPPEDLSPIAPSCIALDLRNSSSFGWRVVPCATQLPILCQTYACLPGTFRCADNSKCIPSEFRHDGFNDCLDGSDESVSQARPLGSSTISQALAGMYASNPVYDWPLMISSGGILSPTTARYGRGECTHRWTVLSPENRFFMISIKWLSPTTTTSIIVEGKDQNHMIFMNSRNSTSSFSLLSSSFVLTAADTDTRKVDFQIYFQEVDPNLCKVSENNILSFDSTMIPMPCNYRFSAKSHNSYLALLIRPSESMATIQYTNSTVTLFPSSITKLLIIPSSSVEILVNSSWPENEKNLEIRFFELQPGGENVDLFLIDTKLEVDWILKSKDVCMEGQFRTLSVNMIFADEENTNPESLESSWEVKKFQKTCNEDGIQIVSQNQSHFIYESSRIPTFGPTSLVIHQSAEPFEFHVIYSTQHNDAITTAPEVFFDEFEEEIVTTTVNGITSEKPNQIFCPLPFVVNGYVSDVSDYSYTPGTTVNLMCNEGYSSPINPWKLYCTQNGNWTHDPSEPEDRGIAFECERTVCANTTELEALHNMQPNTNATEYGTKRIYPAYNDFQPFCVCGDDINYKDQWRCHNYNPRSTFLNACILPQVQDAYFSREDATTYDIFPPGYQIQMKCYVCPSLQKTYFCQNGLWSDSNSTKSYDSFECDCTSDPGFVDPCKPHGVYQQYSGNYSCNCNPGYKFQDGTCKDIDECAEEIDYCDLHNLCQNTEGSFKCVCPSGYHLFNASSIDISQWSPVSSFLIDGYSCVEMTCNYQNDWDNLYGLTVVSPPAENYRYKSGSSTGSLYATNLCSEKNQYNPCVFQFREICAETTLFPVPNPLRSCPTLAEYFNFGSSPFRFNPIFDEVDVWCKDPEMLMIGRPKVFCNSTIQWEILPQCIYESCPDPTQFINPPLNISRITRVKGDGYEIDTTIYFNCPYGYVLSGVSFISCTSTTLYGYEWSNDLPTCFPIGIGTTFPSVTTSEETTFPSPSSSILPSSDTPSEGTTFPEITQTTYSPSSTFSESSQTTHYPGSTISSSYPFTFTEYQPTMTPPGELEDDVVIEGSIIYREKNVLEQKEKWMKTADWIWSSSGCIVHQWTFPTSFLVTSSPILLDSDEIELLVDISQCESRVLIGITSSSDGFIPPISDFRTLINTTSSGSFAVKLRNLKSNLAVSISASAYVQICGVTIREKMCDEVDFEGLHLTSSIPFSMRRYVSASCGNTNRYVPINGYCDNQRGWVIRKPTCLCNPAPQCPSPPPLPQLDQATQCTLNSCSNGVCHQLAGRFECICNQYFINATKPTGEPYCKPDHCRFTSQNRNFGYNCDKGEDDSSYECRDSSSSGYFCQFQGKIANSSYVYLLSENSDNAVSTNVCDSSDTIYAIPSPFCRVQPTPAPPIHDPCISTCQSGQCLRDPSPFNEGVYCICDNDGEDQGYGRSCAVSKFCFNDDGSYRCLNGGSCSLNERICECTSDFSGDYCEVYNGSDNCSAGEKDCVNGRCRREGVDIYCNCNDGYLKDAVGNCTIPWDMCSMNNPCQQSGICSFDEITGITSCNCSNSGWGGAYCEIQPHKDSCDNCQNTEKCFENFTNNVRCQCEAGFTSKYCVVPLDECVFTPCLNGGTCQKYNYDEEYQLAAEMYNCTCPTGFSGTICEISACTLACQNGGTCDFDQNGSPICRCTNQFYGTHCENSCSEQCAHSTGCTQIQNGSIFCECYSGFTSQYCDVVDNVCKANILQCQNGGTCNITTQSCDCSNPFAGKYCETNTNICEAKSIECQNGGTCIPSNGACQCPPNYTGDRCENQLHSCNDITCNNGGTCIPYNATCACLPGTTGDRCQDLGQPCTIYLPDGTTTPYCMNGGRCLNLPNGAACDCNGTDFSGRRCEIKSTFNFNLVFNGLDYAPDIVSNVFSNSIITEFTLCSFVQYNHPTIETSADGVQDASIPNYPPWLVMRGFGDTQRIVIDNNGFFICDTGRRCDRSAHSLFKSTPITANTWHHFCLVSSSNRTNPSYSVYLDGLRVSDQLAENFDPGQNAFIVLAPSNFTEGRFQGMISMTQLFIIRLNESQIGQLAFDCYDTVSGVEYARNPLINWNKNFTRVSSSNPGVYVDPAGICSSVKCMFGRQPKSNNYNSTGTCEKDRISPTVLRCPSNIRRFTTEDFVKVEWSDDDISFFDNIGVVRIEVNYHNGQQFGIGITAVRYIAFDAAGNTAECTFDVIIAQKPCPSQITVEGGTYRLIPRAGPFASTAVIVQCDDSLYPVIGRPRFYTCDIMGDFNSGGWLDETPRRYYLPACGMTTPAEQKINGTVVGSGTCQQVYEKLHSVIWESANCKEISSCRLMILPPCNTTIMSNRIIAIDDSNVALQYTFSTKNATETICSIVLASLQSNFTLVRQDSSVNCDQSYPIQDTNGNSTVCVKCPEGTFGNQTANKCQDCPLNTYRSTNDVNQLSCTPCPGTTITGTVTGAVDESQCYTNCPVGQYESKGSCLPCPEGTFGPTEGLRKCVCCGFDVSTFGDGKTSSTDCTKTCDPGMELVRNETHPIPVCVECSIGFFKTGARGPCVQCPRGLTTSSTGSQHLEMCNLLNCIDANTRRNTNITVTPNTPYSEICITCEQGTFQNVSNSDNCLPCTDLSDDVPDVPVTCQSTCSADIPTEGCNCQLQSSGNSSMIVRNCLPEVIPAHVNSSAIKIVLPIVFGVLLLIVLVVLFCFRKQIIAWFRKTESSDNQHVALSHWNNQTAGSTSPDDPPSPLSRIPPVSRIPRTDLRIVTSREEMDQLPPLPSSSTHSFHFDPFAKTSGGYPTGRSPYGTRQLGTAPPESATTSKGIVYEANGSPRFVRPPTEDDGSSLDSFF